MNLVENIQFYCSSAYNIMFPQKETKAPRKQKYTSDRTHTSNKLAKLLFTSLMFAAMPKVVGKTGNRSYATAPSFPGQDLSIPYLFPAQTSWAAKKGLKSMKGFVRSKHPQTITSFDITPKPGFSFSLVKKNCEVFIL